MPTNLHTVVETLKCMSGQLYSCMFVHQALICSYHRAKNCPEYAYGRANSNPNYQPRFYMVLEDTDVKIGF